MPYCLFQGYEDCKQASFSSGLSNRPLFILLAVSVLNVINERVLTLRSVILVLDRLWQLLLTSPALISVRVERGLHC